MISRKKIYIKPPNIVRRSEKMKAFTVLIFVIAAATAAPQNGPAVSILELLARERNIARIIDGKPAQLGQFPWQAALSVSGNGGSWFCGGSLIDKQWILTAAHCADGARSYRIQLGGIKLNGVEESRIEVSATKSFVHPNYDPWYLTDDIALVRLDSPVELSNTIQTVKLPARGQRVGDNEPVSVSGYGKTSDASSSVSNELNFVELNTISNSDCEEVYGPTITSSTVCCRGNPNHSTCNGDSGGPLVVLDGEPTQVGVVSFGHVAGCAKGYPSGYSRTESYLDWIASTTGIAYSNPIAM